MFSALLLFLLLLSGCTGQKQNQTTIVNVASVQANTTTNQTTNSLTAQTPPISKMQKGVSLSPKSYNSSDFTNFFVKAKQTGTIISWAGDWKEMENEQNGGPKVITELASTYNYTPLVEAQFFTQSTGQLLRPLNSSTKQSYKESAARFAEKYKPAYLGIGIEVNVLYEKSPNDFDDFVQFYPEVYDAVKAKSPNTRVFTIFQLEKMKGMNGGLFGGKNDQNKTQWLLLNKFQKSDIIAFTTYPGLVYGNPSEIPSNYYSEIRNYTSKPIVFTEIGWHSVASPDGWESSEAEQAEFVTVFFNLTNSLNSEFVVWSFMYDPNTIEPFNSMGLWSSNENAKAVWNAWMNS
jgi:hypothetical protein